MAAGRSPGGKSPWYRWPWANATRGLVHLHGLWNAPGSIVLSDRQYGAWLKEDRRGPRALQHAHYGYSLVLVGYQGVRDPALARIRTWLLEQEESAVEHFILARTEEVDEVQSFLEGRLQVVKYGSTPEDLTRLVIEELSSRPLGETGGRAAAVPLTALGPDDAAAQIRGSAESCVSRLGRLNSLLHHLIDRSHAPPDRPGWTMEDQDDFHRFYAQAAGIVAEELANAVAECERAARVLRERAIDLKAAAQVDDVRIANAELLDVCSRVRAIAERSRSLAAEARTNLHDRAGRSRRWGRVRQAIDILLEGQYAAMMADVDTSMSAVDEVSGRVPAGET